MDLLDASYLALAGLAGGAARAVRRGLAEGVRLRLEARPPEDLAAGWIWIHAVSVGELLLAEGLVKLLSAEGHRLHVTTGTPAGLELLGRRVQGWTSRGPVTGGAFPFDDPAGLAPFLRHPPALFLALETELWPNLLRELERAGVPRVVVNGRLTEKTKGPWMARAASRLSLVAARDPESAARFTALGAPEVFTAGNLKADLPPPPSLAPRWSAVEQAWAGDPVWVAGNTLEGEEELLLACWEGARTRHPGLRMVLAPRQPRRFEAAAQALQGRAFRRASESWPEDGWEDVDLILLDSLGELPRVWSLGTLALVGGGWRGQGGHNPLEALRFGLPTAVGPGFENFRDVVEALKGSALLAVVEEGALAAWSEGVLARHPLRAPGTPDPALAPLVGATERVMTSLRKLLPSSASST